MFFTFSDFFSKITMYLCWFVPKSEAFMTLAQLPKSPFIWNKVWSVWTQYMKSTYQNDAAPECRTRQIPPIIIIILIHTSFCSSAPFSAPAMITSQSSDVITWRLVFCASGHVARRPFWI